MTISQSRYGGAAEVGRAPSKPGRKTDRNAYGVLAGVGTAGAGAGAAAYGRAKGKSLLGDVNRASARVGRADMNLNRPGGPLASTGMKGSRAKALSELAAAGRESEAAQRRYAAGAGKAKMLARGGKLTALAGLLGAGVAGVNLEAKRGTVGYRRPTRTEALNSQQNSRRKSISEGQAAGDRYRRMNGM
jgi:hypothetical protein